MAAIPPVAYPIALSAVVVGGLFWLAHTTKEAAAASAAAPPPSLTVQQMLQQAQVFLAQATTNPASVDPGQLNNLSSRLRAASTDPSVLVVANALDALAASTRTIQNGQLSPSTMTPGTVTTTTSSAPSATRTTAPNGGPFIGQGSGVAAVPAGATRTSLNITPLTTPLPTSPLAPDTIFSTSDGLVEKEPSDPSPDQAAVATWRAYANRSLILPVGLPTAEDMGLGVVPDTARSFASQALQSGYPATALALTRLAAAKDAQIQALANDPRIQPLGKTPPAAVVTPLSQAAIQAVSDANQVRFGVVTMTAPALQGLIATLTGLSLAGIASTLETFTKTSNAHANALQEERR